MAQLCQTAMNALLAARPSHGYRSGDELATRLGSRHNEKMSLSLSSRRQVVIIGGGVTGTALAAELSSVPGIAVTVLERHPAQSPRGSTAYAPGFLGVLNERRVLTELARASADRYERLSPHPSPAFARAGGLEVGYTAAGATMLEHRVRLADAAGLPARLLDAAQAARLVPDLVDGSRCVAAVLFSADAVVRADLLTTAMAHRAATSGVRFVHDGPVIGLDVRSGRVRGVRTEQELYPADDVVIACGVWSPLVAAMAGVTLPLTPVAHPYVYGPVRPTRTHVAGPFVRWPEYHVYARDHGDRLGIGSYRHAPLPVPASELGVDARRAWPGERFDAAVSAALTLLPEAGRWRPEQRINGVFAMTADNLPLLGPVPAVTGLWAAAALWITHAAGAAAWLAAWMTGAEVPTEAGALRPDRFAGRPDDELAARSLERYCDIYARQDAVPVLD